MSASSSSSKPMIQPALYGGFGEKAGEPHGGLLGRGFLSTCPPVASIDSIIIAVCGPNNLGGNAHPNKDGWIFSDFHMFYHLFRGTAKEQHWLTCASPNSLVKEYGQFVHGNSKTDARKIVLDESILADLENVKVFDVEELLNTFMSYVTKACQQTRNTERFILVLIFGHGVEFSYKVVIVGHGLSDTRNKLSIEDFRRAIVRHNPNPNVAVLTTICYGGGWCQATSMNISAMAGTTHDDEVLSWRVSASKGRVGGSRYATGVAQALIKQEIAGIAEDDWQEIHQSPTYASLVAMIHDTLRNEVDVRENNEISFSAKDDIWGAEWRQKSGFPLSSYQARWGSLESIPIGDTTGNIVTASIKFSDTISLTTPQAEYRLKKIAYDYMESKPGHNDAAKNVFVHGRCAALLQGQRLPAKTLESLSASLRYRWEIINLATEYKERLGLFFADCCVCDTYEYHMQVKKDADKYSMYTKIGRMVAERKLFDEPGQDEGFPYVKGELYLRMILTESNWSRQRVETALDELIKISDRHNKYNVIVRTFRFWEDKTMRKAIGTLAKSTRGRLRSLSPVKHQRKSLDRTFAGVTLR